MYLLNALRLKLKMASPRRTPVTESVKAPKFKVPDYSSKQQASSNNIMERRAQPNDTIMAWKRVKIGLVSEACPIVPAAIYFVRLPSPPLAHFLDCLLSS